MRSTARIWWNPRNSRNAAANRARRSRTRGYRDSSIVSIPTAISESRMPYSSARTMKSATKDGSRAPGPRLPTGIIVAAVIVALVAVSGLILALYRETRGPGEILRRFAEAVDGGDCEGSYELLDGTVRATLDEGAWCEGGMASADAMIDADFSLERAILEGDRARVEISGVPQEIWILGRHGERSWRVIGPESGFSA